MEYAPTATSTCRPHQRVRMVLAPRRYLLRRQRMILPQTRRLEYDATLWVDNSEWEGNNLPKLNNSSCRPPDCAWAIPSWFRLPNAPTDRKRQRQYRHEPHREAFLPAVLVLGTTGTPFARGAHTCAIAICETEKRVAVHLLRINSVVASHPRPAPEVWPTTRTHCQSVERPEWDCDTVP